MARKRDLKPSFFTDAELADCNAYGMLAFAGLWCHADRDGRLKDQPRELKVKILPYFDVDFDSVLSDLEGGGFVTRYEVGGKRYLQVENFTEHQNPHPNEPSLGYPANPHGYREQLQNIAENDLQPLRARESVLGVRGKELEVGSVTARAGELGDTLAALEKIWPTERCRPTNSELRERSLFDAHRSGDLPEDLADAARLYLDAHGFADGAVSGCPNLHRWIEERRWRDPLPQKRESPAERLKREIAEAEAAA